jgi:hypothetical protein
MRVLTLTELMRLTRIEFCDLLMRITNALPKFPESSAERTNTLLNLGNIRSRHMLLKHQRLGNSRDRRAPPAPHVPARSK